MGWGPGNEETGMGHWFSGMGMEITYGVAEEDCGSESESTTCPSPEEGGREGGRAGVRGREGQGGSKPAFLTLQRDERLP